MKLGTTMDLRSLSLKLLEARLSNDRITTSKNSMLLIRKINVNQRQSTIEIFRPKLSKSSFRSRGSTEDSRNRFLESSKFSKSAKFFTRMSISPTSRRTSVL